MLSFLIAKIVLFFNKQKHAHQNRQYMKGYAMNNATLVHSEGKIDESLFVMTAKTAEERTPFERGMLQASRDYFSWRKQHGHWRSADGQWRGKP